MVFFTKILKVLKFFFAAFLVLMAYFMAATAIWIFRYGYKPSGFLALALTWLALFGVGKMYPSVTHWAKRCISKTGVPRVFQWLTRKAASIKSSVSSAIERRSISSEKAKHNQSATVKTETADQKILPPLASTPSVTVPPSKSLKQSFQSGLERYKQSEEQVLDKISALLHLTQPKVEEKPAPLIRPVGNRLSPHPPFAASLLNEDTAKPKKKKNNHRRQLEKLKSLKTDVEMTLSTVRMAQSSVSAASSAEFLDFFSDKKWVSMWSTYENTSASNDIRQAQHAVESLHSRLSHLENELSLPNSDWLDLYVDFQFDLDFDVLSYFNFDSLSSSYSDLIAVADNLQTLSDRLNSLIDDIEFKDPFD